MAEEDESLAVSIQLLKEYIVLARMLNFNLAANKLFISQPTLSNHMKRLEQCLNVELIQHGTRTTLTHAGQDFIPMAESLVRRYEETVRDLRRIASQSDSLEIDDPINTRFLPEATTRTFLFFEREYPNVRLHLRSTSGKSLQEALKSGFVDIAKMVTTCPEGSEEFEKICLKRGVDAIQIAEEHPSVWLQRNHPLATKDAISIKDLVGVAILTPSDIRYDGWCTLVEEWFAKKGKRAQFQTVVTGEIEEYFMARLDDSVLVLPDALPLGGNLLAARGVVSRPIADQDVNYYVHLASLKSNRNQLVPIYKHCIAKYMEMISCQQGSQE